MPNDLRTKSLRAGSKYKIERLRELGAHCYANKRAEAPKEFAAILDEIVALKGDRDRLVHGTYDQQANQDPASVTVFYKRRHWTYKLERLAEIGAAIGRANSALMEFDSWVDYEMRVASLRKSLGLDRQ